MTTIRSLSRKPLLGLFAIALLIGTAGSGARTPLVAQADPNTIVDPGVYEELRFRSVGPHRGGRVTAVAGVRRQPHTFYMGASGGGVWKTTDAGHTLAQRVGRLLRHRVDRRHRRLRVQPRRRLRRHRQRRDQEQRHPRQGRLQVDRRRQDLDVRRPEGRRADRLPQGVAAGSRHGLRRGARPAVRAEPRPRRVPHDRRRARPGRRCCSSTTTPASCRSR